MNLKPRTSSPHDVTVCIDSRHEYGANNCPSSTSPSSTDDRLSSECYNKYCKLPLPTHFGVSINQEKESADDATPNSRHTFNNATSFSLTDDCCIDENHVTREKWVICENHVTCEPTLTATCPSRQIENNCPCITPTTTDSLTTDRVRRDNIGRTFEFNIDDITQECDTQRNIVTPRNLDELVENNTRSLRDDDNLLPRGEETSQNMIKACTKFGLTWTTSSQDDITKKKKDLLARKSKPVLSFLHETTKGDVETAKPVLDLVVSRFQSSVAKIASKNINENNETTIISNIKKFIELPQNQSNGKRDMNVQQALVAVLTSVVGPSYGYCTTPFGEGEVVSFDKLRGVYEIHFNWGAHMFCHEIEFEKYVQSGKLPLSSVKRSLGLGSRMLLYKCRAIRNAMSGGRIQPFKNMIAKPSQ